MQTLSLPYLRQSAHPILGGKGRGTGGKAGNTPASQVVSRADWDSHAQARQQQLPAAAQPGCTATITRVLHTIPSVHAAKDTRLSSLGANFSIERRRSGHLYQVLNVNGIKRKRVQRMRPTEPGNATPQISTSYLCHSHQQETGHRRPPPGGLVEEHDCWVFQHRSCDGDALFLPSRHLDAPLPDLRVVPIRKPLTGGRQRSREENRVITAGYMPRLRHAGHAWGGESSRVEPINAVPLGHIAVNQPCLSCACDVAGRPKGVHLHL